MIMKDDIDDNRLSNLWYMMMIDDDDDDFDNNNNKCSLMIWYDNVDDVDDRWRWYCW